MPLLSTYDDEMHIVNRRESSIINYILKSGSRLAKSYFKNYKSHRFYFYDERENFLISSA